MEWSNKSKQGIKLSLRLSCAVPVLEDWLGSRKSRYSRLNNMAQGVTGAQLVAGTREMTYKMLFSACGVERAEEADGAVGMMMGG